MWPADSADHADKNLFFCALCAICGPINLPQAKKSVSICAIRGKTFHLQAKNLRYLRHLRATKRKFANI